MVIYSFPRCATIIAEPSHNLEHENKTVKIYVDIKLHPKPRDKAYPFCYEKHNDHGGILINLLK